MVVDGFLRDDEPFGDLGVVQPRPSRISISSAQSPASPEMNTRRPCPAAVSAYHSSSAAKNRSRSRSAPPSLPAIDPWPSPLTPPSSGAASANGKRWADPQLGGQGLEGKDYLVAGEGK